MAESFMIYGGNTEKHTSGNTNTLLVYNAVEDKWDLAPGTQPIGKRSGSSVAMVSRELFQCTEGITASGGYRNY